VDTGAINPGWPVDVEGSAIYNGVHFTAAIQQQRPALAIVGNILYVGYGSMRDCDLYHGWLVGVPINNPASVMAWAAATATGTNGGAYGESVASPVTATICSLPPVTLTTLEGSGAAAEAVIRFQPGPIFSEDPSDYWGRSTGLTLTVRTGILGARAVTRGRSRRKTPSNLVVCDGKTTLRIC